jgi:hypothetical protein
MRSALVLGAVHPAQQRATTGLAPAISARSCPETGNAGRGAALRIARLACRQTGCAIKRHRIAPRAVELLEARHGRGVHGLANK